MTYDQGVPGAPEIRYRRMEDVVVEPPSRFAPLIRIVLGLVIAIDVSLLAAPIYFGTVRPCNMVALSRASQHSGAVDEEIGLSDEIARDVFYVSAAWTRTREGFASCAGEIGGRTLAALAP